eukprot:4594184-Pyramimonas_sp.AAC.1
MADVVADRSVHLGRLLCSPSMLSRPVVETHQRRKVGLTPRHRAHRCRVEHWHARWRLDQPGPLPRRGATARALAARGRCLEHWQ